MLGISGGCLSVRLIRELDVYSVFKPFFGVRLIHECVLYAQIYGKYSSVPEQIILLRLQLV